jgi:UDP-glucose 4-epimerase
MRVVSVSGTSVDTEVIGMSYAKTTECEKLVLVTGGAGFLGHHLVRKLVGRGCRVRVLDDLSTGSRENLLQSGCAELVIGNVLDRSVVERAAEDVELVLHLAANVGMQRVQVDPQYTFHVSDEGTANIITATGDVPILLMSSSSVYGLEHCDCVRESEPLEWTQALAYDGGSVGYACGKQQLERLGLKAAASGRRVMVLRPFNVVGPGQSGAYGMVLPRFVEKALRGEPLSVYDDGRQSRCFSDVRTFVDCVSRLLETPEAWEHDRNPINLGSAESTCIQTLAELVLATTCSSSKIVHIPFKTRFPGKRDVRSRLPDTRRLEALLGAVQWPDIESIVQEFTLRVMTCQKAMTSSFESVGASGMTPRLYS